GEVIHGFFAVARETAWACSTMLLVNTFLSVIPVGLVWAQFAHVDLREVASRSEHAGEKLEKEPGGNHSADQLPSESEG
ncbi:MAG TPA: hypothetical protein VF730_10600, partial [Terracidiphilus sp.]